MINNKVTAIGGKSGDGRYSPPADLTIKSPAPEWREWGKGSLRAGFMATTVSQKWLQDMCDSAY